MQDDRTDLMLFIDLGFILLVGFLILTDTTAKENVPLPSSEDEETQRAPDEQRAIYEVFFNANLQFVVVAVREQEEVCAPVGPEALLSCLAPLVARSESSVIVLAPQELATTQQLVSLLDICIRNNWRCTVNS